MDQVQSDTFFPNILYEDQDIILINKPSGLLSVPDGYDPFHPHLKSILKARFGDIWIVHRLDKDTSGVLLLARNAASHRKLNEAFRIREIVKIYHGLVAPLPSWQEIDIQLPLLTNADRKHRTRVSPINGKAAHSSCKVLKWFKTGVLLEIQIHTGISHQIRAHLREYDLALLGDELYCSGLPPQPIAVARTMLHARQLSFTHPVSGETITHIAGYPEDFRAAYTQLKLTKVQNTEI